MLKSYKKHADERAKQGVPPLPLDANQTSKLVDLLKSEHKESELLLLILLISARLAFDLFPL